MNAVLITPKQNRLLAKLPVAEFQRLEPELEAVLLCRRATKIDRWSLLNARRQF